MPMMKRSFTVRTLIAGCIAVILFLLCHFITAVSQLPALEQRHAVTTIDGQLWWLTERHAFGHTRYACMPRDTPPTIPDEMRFSAPEELVDRLKNLVANNPDARQIIIDYQGFPFQWATGSLMLSGPGENLRNLTIHSQTSMLAFGDISKDWPTFTSVSFGLRSFSFVCVQLITWFALAGGILLALQLVFRRTKAASQ
jgi:hypothetical protein